MKKIVIAVAAVALSSGVMSVVAGASSAQACPAKHVSDYQEFVDNSSCANIVLTKTNSVPNASTWYAGQYWTGSVWQTGSSGRHTLNDGSRRTTVLTGIRTGTHIRIAAGTEAGIDLEY